MPTHDFIPARSTHAIVGTAFACELTAPFSTEIIAAVIKRYDSDDTMKQLLPAKGEDRGFKIEIGHQAAQMEQPGGLMGARFERYASDGSIEWSLSFRGNLLLVACNAYTRWNEVFPQAVQLLNWGLEAISPFGIGLAAVGLEYQDEFIWQGDLNKMDASALFDSQTDILPKNMLSRIGLWHNYSGWFEEAFAPVPGRRLINVNVSFVQRGDKGIAQLSSSHKGVFSDAADAPADPTNLLDALHSEHKLLIGRLVSEQIKQKIRFDKKYANE